MKSTKSSWKFLRRALRCNTRAKWHFVIRLHTKWIKCCSRNRMDDAMFKVAESIVLSWRRLSCQIYKRSSQLCGAKLWCMNIYTGQKCRITVYPLTCQHYICPIGLHSTICKGNADYSTLNREHFVMPKGRSDSPMGTGDELGHQNASNTHTHMQGALRDRFLVATQPQERFVTQQVGDFQGRLHCWVESRWAVGALDVWISNLPGQLVHVINLLFW